jgi:hypothetical protein
MHKFPFSLLAIASTFAFFIVLTATSKQSLALDDQNINPGEGPQSTLTMNELESSIVEAFTRNECSRVKSSADPKLLKKFRPLVLGVIAYCTPDRKKAEKLFTEAEKKAPYDALILVLHARYLFKIDAAAAQPLWGKILVIARNPSLKKVAEDYLEGVETPEEGLPITKDWTFVGSLETAGSYENNPTGQALSVGTRPGSYALNNSLLFGANRSLKSTDSLGANVSITTNNYFSAHYADFWENDFDLPYSTRVGNNEDLIFRPLGRYSQYSDLTYEVMGGFAVTGVAYREKYKQSVQTSIFINHYFIDVATPESGTHFRFEYNWEFYPDQYGFRLLAFIEHVAARVDTTITPGAQVPYSHNDIGTNLFFDYRFHGVIFSFYPSITVREDDNDSIYEDLNGNTIDKRRTDTSLDFKAKLSVPLNRNFEAIAYYDWNRTYSNIGIGDYIDRNFQDQIVGIGIRTFVTNY